MTEIISETIALHKNETLVLIQTPSNLTSKTIPFEINRKQCQAITADDFHQEN